MVHAALVPVSSDFEGANRFERFLNSEQDTLETGLAQFERDHWRISSQRTVQEWPAVCLWE